MRITIKNLMSELQLERDVATRVYRLCKGKVKPNHDLVDNKYKPFNPYSDVEYRLFEIDTLIETYGVEYIRHKEDKYYASYGIEYCNNGQTYTPTICYDHMRKQWSIACWGDFVEHNSKLGQEY